MIQSIQTLHNVLLPFVVAISMSTGVSHCLAANTQSTHFYLVGVGPGDADLMTLRAVKVIESAEVILCRQNHAKLFSDYLKDKEVHSEFSGMIPFYSRDPAQYEGEERKRAEQYQEKRQRLVTLVRGAVEAGRTVAVLDNGDPMIYGPCTWMLEEFADLNPKVIPGLSSFNAANAALGVGITSGGRTKSVTLTAGDWMKADDTIEKLSVHRNTMGSVYNARGVQGFRRKAADQLPTRNSYRDCPASGSRRWRNRDPQHTRKYPKGGHLRKFAV